MKPGKLHSVLMALSIVLAGLCTMEARAAAVVYENVGFFAGPGHDSHSFTVASAGTYQAKLTDFKFPEYFSELSLSVTTSLTELGRVDTPGLFQFDAAPGTTFYANVYGVPAGALDLGLYGINVSAMSDGNVSPVPVPMSLVLMVSGMIALRALGRGAGGVGASESMTVKAIPA